MSDPTGQGALLVARSMGAIAGAAISIAYVLPRSRREAALRFLTGVTGGFVFGPSAGATLARYLEIRDVLSVAEIVLAGSAVASLFIWTAIGLVLRISANAQTNHASRIEKGSKSDD